ncbi:hypothetical protein [Escherichia coli]|uniref:hypothetical protein n=1 Tax=Escherichia coli TaxID=562 RepID=UPI0020270BF9|nr:hypothetical protein [Escherichia coli]MEC6432572.1 hypothetical protein [Escherichia coli]MEC6497213.1 hypothetical protein [Escherichia coli]
MQFKDLPEDIQKIAADTLKDHLSVINLTKEPKANLENISRNMRDVFVGMYAMTMKSTRNIFKIAALIKDNKTSNTI